jgi:hypothetical protein
MGFRVEAGDISNNGTRNEVVQTLDDSNCPLCDMYPEGVTRYYSWYVLFPEASLFPDPPAYPQAQSSFNTFFQFHGSGNCGTGIPLNLALKRTDVGSSNQIGNQYQLTYSGQETYGGNAVRYWPASHEGTIPIWRNHWYKFVLKVRWSTVNGQVSLMVDGNTVFTHYRKTLFTWPAQGDTAAGYCNDDGPLYANGTAVAGERMPVFLKQGLYRDSALTGAATIWQTGVVSSSYCNFWDGCP